MVLPNRYNWKNVQRLLGNPKLVLGELNRLGVRFDQQLLAAVPRSPIDVIAEDWDNLIVLDACRYDIFEAVADDDGELTPVECPGGNSKDFMDVNFVGKELHDTVYVTSNPHAERIPAGTFHAFEPVYLSNWSDELGTVLPDAVVEATRRAREEYEDKRLIAHFMQPHAPFIGEFGESIPHTVARTPEASTRSVWANIRYGFEDVTIDDVRRAYRENTEIAYTAARELASSLDGKTVVTSDHGELLGERLYPIPVKGLGHAEVPNVRVMREVPWYELEADERRSITAEPPRDPDRQRRTVTEQLEALGYR